MSASKWDGHEAVYHVYPLSFADSDSDGYGDLKGIISRLDYVRDLGVDAVWLSPTYRSPMVDFGYDVTDHRKIDPLFGTLAVMDRLIAATHRRSLRVMLDFVGNHTSDAHRWFVQSRSSRRNRRRDWYVWRDPARDGGPPNNWLSVFGGPAWTFDETTGQYYLHSFLREQPDLNWRNPEVVREMAGVMRFWFGRGVDGFRMDAVCHLMKDPRFRDEPLNPAYRAGVDDPYLSLRHVRSQRHPDIFPLLGRLGRVAGRFGALLIGEAYLGASEMRPYANVDPQHYAPMNFGLMSLPWEADAFRKSLSSYGRILPAGASPNYVLGNHDRTRLVTRLGEGRARAAAVIQMTLRGMPFVYYGDEIGMGDSCVGRGCGRDPLSARSPGLLLGRDPQRSPMRWTSGPHAGFSTAEPWLPVEEGPSALNIEQERSDPRSFLALYASLLRLRRMGALRDGSFRLVPSDKQTLAFRRDVPGETAVTVVNFADRPRRVAVGGLGEASVLCDSALGRAAGSAVDLRRLRLAPDEAVVVLVSPG